MVVKLEGKVNGNIVVFSRDEGDLWQVIVPPELDGVYIVEMTAIDDADNITFVTRYGLAVDLTAMHVILRPFTYYAQLRCGRSYRAVLKNCEAVL